MLTIEFSETRRPPVLLDKRRVRIGTGDSNEIRLLEEGVEDVHAEIDILSDGIYLVNLAGDSAPVSVNGAPVMDRKVLGAGDVIRIGEAEVRVGQYDGAKTQVRPTVSTWLLHSADKTHDTVSIPHGQLITFGRSTGCDVVIPDQFVSRQHAEFYVKGGHFFVKDLGSTQGTFVNDEQVSEAELRAGDEVRLERFRFLVECHVGMANIVGEEPPEEETTKTVSRTGIESSPGKAGDRSVVSGNTPHDVDTTDQKSAPRAQPDGVGDAVVAEQDEPSVSSEENSEDSQSKRRGNWWERQSEGPKGTTIVKVQELAKAEEAPEYPPAVETDRPILIGMTGSCRDLKFELRPGNLLVGRGESADIQVDDPQVSETHAQLVGDGRRWKIINLIAANGTFVNGKRVQTAYLRSGDIVGFGGVNFQFADSSGTNDPEDADNQKVRTILVAIAGTLAAALTIGMAVFAWLNAG